jgi:hypothetical protein
VNKKFESIQKIKSLLLTPTVEVTIRRTLLSLHETEISYEKNGDLFSIENEYLSEYGEFKDIPIVLDPELFELGDDIFACFWSDGIDAYVKVGIRDKDITLQTVLLKEDQERLQRSLKASFVDLLCECYGRQY